MHIKWKYQKIKNEIINSIKFSSIEKEKKIEKIKINTQKLERYKIIPFGFHCYN